MRGGRMDLIFIYLSVDTNGHLGFERKNNNNI